MGPHIAGRAPPAERFINVRHADPEQRRGRIDPQPPVHRPQHPIPKVLRISHAHETPSADSIGAENHDRKPNGIPLDSVSPENALDVENPMAAYAGLAFPSLLWGSSFLLIKIASRAFDPFYPLPPLDARQGAVDLTNGSPSTSPCAGSIRPNESNITGSGSMGVSVWVCLERQS